MLDKDILTEFQKEANGLLTELGTVVEDLEEESKEFPAQKLEQFAQRIDRIMGAAQTLNTLDPNHQGLARIGAIAQICKRLGYKAAEYKVAPLVPIFAAFWADTLEVVQDLINCVDNDAKSAELAKSFSSVLQNRLTWLSERVQKMAPKQSAGDSLQSQLGVDQILQKINK